MLRWPFWACFKKRAISVLVYKQMSKRSWNPATFLNFQIVISMKARKEPKGSKNAKFYQISKWWYFKCTKCGNFTFIILIAFAQLFICFFNLWYMSLNQFKFPAFLNRKLKKGRSWPSVFFFQTNFRFKLRHSYMLCECLVSTTTELCTKIRVVDSKLVLNLNKHVWLVLSFLNSSGASFKLGSTFQACFDFSFLTLKLLLFTKTVTSRNSINKKSTIFIRFWRNLVKMILTWDLQVHQVSSKSDKNCGFFINAVSGCDFLCEK